MREVAAQEMWRPSPESMLKKKYQKLFPPRDLIYEFDMRPLFDVESNNKKKTNIPTWTYTPRKG